MLRSNKRSTPSPRWKGLDSKSLVKMTSTRCTLAELVLSYQIYTWRQSLQGSDVFFEDVQVASPNRRYNRGLDAPRNSQFFGSFEAHAARCDPGRREKIKFRIKDQVRLEKQHALHRRT